MVQHLGLDMLQRQDTIERGKKVVDDFRLARLASGVEPHLIFPEYFPESLGKELDLTTAGDDVLVQDGMEYDYSGVDWQGPADLPANEMELLQQFMGDGRVDVAGSDLPERPEPGEWH